MWEKFPDETQHFGYGPSAVVVDDLLLLSPTAEGAPRGDRSRPKDG